MDPVKEYTLRLEGFRAEEEALGRRFIVIGNWRLAAGLGAAILLWFIFVRHAVSAWALLIPVGIFTALAVDHQRIIRRRTLAKRAITYYERGLARVRDQWPGTGSRGDRFRNAGHVYAEDLDLFGKGSAFELIATARTAAGEALLADWLLRPAARREVFERQEAVRELTSNLQLREDIALLAEDVKSDVDAEALEKWGSAPRVIFHPLLRPAGAMLGLAGITLLISFFAQWTPLWSLAVILAGDAVLIYTLRSRVTRVLESVENSGRDLQVLSGILGRLQREQFQSPRLKRLRADLAVKGTPASLRIQRLGRLVDWSDSSDHVLLRIMRPLVLYREQLAISFERWRQDSGRFAGAWVRAVAEFEALSSFATLAFERPSWRFPELLETDAATFRAEALRHPLIPSAECVPNDLVLESGRKLLIVSGSNMSGKSTLLRAVGLNTVLAWAGSAVAASSLRLCCLQTGASIRVNDSLQDHRSRFLAEITRIRQILELTNSGRPVLFLLDELLSGTNSHDRRIGATGIARELLAANAIGLITTHDLALARIDEDLAAGIVNVHFEDQMDGNRMLFDYKLKPGVVTRSNAIALMRAVGLNV